MSNKTLGQLACDARLINSYGTKVSLSLASVVEELALLLDDKMSELDARLVEVEPVRVVEGEFKAAALHARGIKAVACPATVVEFRLAREAAVQQVDGVVEKIKSASANLLEVLVRIRSNMAAAETGIEVVNAVHPIYEPELRLKLSPESVAVLDVAARLLMDGCKQATQNIKL